MSPRSTGWGTSRSTALAGVSLTIRRGEMTAIMGPSGSGKSTIMNIIGCLDVPTSGRYLLDGEDIGEMNDDRLAAIRNRKVRVRLPDLQPPAKAFRPDERRTAIAVRERTRTKRTRAGCPCAGGTRRPGAPQAGRTLRRAAAAGRHRTGPGQEPSVLLADEPTGNLDTASSREIMSVIQDLNRRSGITVVIVTHERDIATHAGRVVTMLDGKVLDDRRQEPEPVPEPAQT